MRACGPSIVLLHRGPQAVLVQSEDVDLGLLPGTHHLRLHHLEFCNVLSYAVHVRRLSASVLHDVSQRVAEYVREQLPPELLFDIAIPRTMASIDAFAAGQPVVLRSPGDGAALAYLRLAELLDPRLR